jgi:hypothetical protein
MKAPSTKWIARALVFLTLTAGACGYQTDVRVSRDRIQGLVERKFPIEKDAMLAKLKLHSPKVFFQGNDIGLRLEYDAGLLGKSTVGQIVFHGPPVYQPEQGAFYLSRLTIDEFTVDEHSLSHKQKLRDKVTSVLDVVMPRVPLYHLKQQDFKHRLAKLLLKRVRVEDDTLVLTMGL